MIVDVAGEALDLLPQRAVHWGRARTVFAADPHFGKDAHFRSRGVPMPAGTTSADLERMSSVLATTEARRLVVLGDFLHDAGSRADETFEALRAWRERHAALEIVLVAGNHDARSGLPPDALRIAVVREPHVEVPFTWLHYPREIDRSFALAGHVHPGVELVPPRGRRVRAPIFWLREHVLVLPSFGGFTGLCIVEPRAGDRVFLCGPESVVAWPSR